MKSERRASVLPRSMTMKHKGKGPDPGASQASAAKKAPQVDRKEKRRRMIQLLQETSVFEDSNTAQQEKSKELVRQIYQILPSSQNAGMLMDQMGSGSQSIFSSAASRAKNDKALFQWSDVNAKQAYKAARASQGSTGVDKSKLYLSTKSAHQLSPMKSALELGVVNSRDNDSTVPSSMATKPERRKLDRSGTQTNSSRQSAAALPSAGQSSGQPSHNGTGFKLAFNKLDLLKGAGYGDSLMKPSADIAIRSTNQVGATEQAGEEHKLQRRSRHKLKLPRRELRQSDSLASSAESTQRAGEGSLHGASGYSVEDPYQMRGRRET